MYDYHVHSRFSADSTMKMAEACEAAISAGITEIAFTEHMDLFYPNCDIIFQFDYEAYAEAIREAQARFQHRLTVLRGVEVGIHPFKHAEHRSFINENVFDFVIGSIHLAADQDLHNGDFFSERTVTEAVESYFLTVNQYVKEFTDFDVLGHLTLIKRYLHFLNTHWSDVNWKAYDDIIADTFRTLIETGRGIEVNMSGFRYHINCSLPNLPLLKLYKELGGEIITVGTDAHSKEFVGKHLDLGYHLLQQAGFKYVTTFRERKPLFNPLT